MSRRRLSWWCAAAALLICCTTLWPQRVLAAAWWPADSAGQQEYEAALQKVLADPDDPVAMATFANVATRVGNYESAVSTLERVLMMRPELSRVRLELGVLYYRMHALAVAQVQIQRALDSGKLSADEADRARAFLLRIQWARAGFHLFGSVSAGVRYQSNANAGLTSPSLRDAGFDVPTPPNRRTKGDFNTFVQIQAVHSYDLPSPYADDWETTLFVYWPHQFEVRDADVGVAEATTGPRFRLFPGAIDNLTIRPYGIGGVSEIDYEFNNAVGGGGVELSKRFGPSFLGRLVYEARYRRFDNLHDDQSGLTNRVEATVARWWTSDLVTALAGSFADDDANESFRSNRQWAVWGTGTWRYRNPLGLSPWPWEAAALGRWTKLRYRAPDDRIDPFTRRDDDELQFVLRNSIGVARDVALFAEFEYRDQRSNLSNDDFTNFVGAIGATWRF